MGPVFWNIIFYIYSYYIFFIFLCVWLVVGVQQNHGDAGAEWDWPPPEASGYSQSGQLLQGPDPGAEGQSAKGTVQLRPPRYVGISLLTPQHFHVSDSSLIKNGCLLVLKQLSVSFWGVLFIHTWSQQLICMWLRLLVSRWYFTVFNCYSFILYRCIWQRPHNHDSVGHQGGKNSAHPCLWLCLPLQVNLSVGLCVSEASRCGSNVTFKQIWWYFLIWITTLCFGIWSSVMTSEC